LQRRRQLTRRAAKLFKQKLPESRIRRTDINGPE
jgi:hypothetical protein